MDDIERTADRLIEGTAEVINRELLIQKLKRSRDTGTPLIVKLGVDPTAPDIHLGHTVVMEKLRQFQELGHQVVFLIGDMTARIGDPTNRDATRKQLTKEEVEAFAATYIAQANKVLDASRLILRYNSEWLEPMKMADVLQLLSQMTLARVLERDDFHKRFTEHVPIHLHELMYPLMQGYDSVALRADVELGGTDQKFNIMTARQIQEAYGVEPEVGMFMPILEGTDGVRRMGKSLGNYVGVNEPPDEMYGKVMSIPDTLIQRWSLLLLGKDPAELERRLAAGANPRDLKAELAFDIVTRFWDREAAQNAQEKFDKTFRQKEVPADAPRIAWTPELARVTALQLVAQLPGIPSRQEARRLLQQGAVLLNGERLDMMQEVSVEPGSWIKVGKRRYFRFE
ncbi:tyrosyl-tRNA synthetase [Sulfobacillus acidophilus TPY]|uniref:Tyrosine--tRNA ligase n=1 Tax=Sulfobacillus acidophilus (strain ATCC 700253 / DSM 10332 / NAL) TaxID=679936 RepID=G8TWJ8_SULAD|nr:tyrosyl-tRNA synthetase [Sulfobacillus acidophilus TPY]AEW04896.1 tyrosyl-tRNA synthetase [Sulfobacillus acidophilus DSM 10332]